MMSLQTPDLLIQVFVCLEGQSYNWEGQSKIGSDGTELATLALNFVRSSESEDFASWSVGSVLFLSFDLPGGG